MDYAFFHPSPPLLLFFSFPFLSFWGSFPCRALAEGLADAEDGTEPPLPPLGAGELQTSPAQPALSAAAWELCVFNISPMPAGETLMVRRRRSDCSLSSVGVDVVILC